jgi:hypothetical protein
MASTTPTKPSARRAASQPVQRRASGFETDIETLYNHPSARIISFTTAAKQPPRPSSSSEIPRVEEKPGTLPWASRAERTIAVGTYSHRRAILPLLLTHEADLSIAGPLSIYRAAGSVAFLNCSYVLQPILLKSQCWEVDGSGKFVLQRRPPQYWRIEVPCESDDEKARVEELKEVLDKVLSFEKTPCPFKRNFYVELPEPPLTPVKKRPWKPVEKPKLVIEPAPKPRAYSYSSRTAQEVSKDISYPTTPITDHVRSRSPSLSHDSRPSTATTRATDDDDFLKHESESDASSRCVSDLREDRSPPPKSISEPSDIADDGWTALDEDGEGFSDATDDTNMTPRAPLPPSTQPVFTQPVYGESEVLSRPQALQNCSRSITAPPVLSLVTSQGSRGMSRSPLGIPEEADSESKFSSSVESFYTVQSWHSPLTSPSPMATEFSASTPTYPYPHENIALPKQRKRDASETPITPITPHMWETTSTDSDAGLGSSSPPPQTPTLVNDVNEKSDEEQFEAITPPTIRSKIRSHTLASGTSRRRGLSPLPPAVNLFSPPGRRLGSLQTAKHIPTAIIQKTYEILVSPPSHLLYLMVNIASKISAGEWRGMLPGQGDAAPWDFEDEYGVTEWTEDDYGISLFTTQDKPKKEADSNQGGSWEMD